MATRPYGWPFLLALRTFHFTMADSLAPLTDGADRLVGPLRAATICTADLDLHRLFFCDGMGMTLDGPLPLSDAAREACRQRWGLDAETGWETYHLRRPDVPEAATIRLLVLDRVTASVHASWSPHAVGPLSLGFPTDDLETLDAALRGLSFGALNPLSRYEVPRPDGSTYGIHESIFGAPDFVHAVGISRRDGMTQLGPTDSHGRGGPAYTAYVTEDSDALVAFFVDVLGWEIRSDREWESTGETGAMQNPEGTVFRFAIVYAKGARTGHVLVVHFRTLDATLPGVAPRPPHRGLTMWTFPVTRLDAVAERARAVGATVVWGPGDSADPLWGTTRAMTLLTPDGFTVELYETDDA